METKNNNNGMNYSEFKTAAKGAKIEVTVYTKNPLRIVHTLNKLAKRNEWIDGIDLKKIGEEAKKHFGTSDYFTLYPFRKDCLCRICYEKTIKAASINRIREQGFDFVSTDKEKAVYLHPVTLTENGVLSAYLYMLRPSIIAAEKAVKEAEKAEKAAIQKAVKEAAKRQIAGRKKAEAEAKKKALSDYKAGRITAVQFAEIMAA